MNSKILLIVSTLLLTVLVSCHKTDGNSSDQEVKKEKPFHYDDYNDVQLQYAEKYGITPLANRDTDFTKIPKLEKIESCDNYRVEYLSHSVPYLTHNAKALLNEIGKAFQDSLKARGVKVARVCVTSVLRTEADVLNLQKVNTNAAAKSSHCYGTTFDIAHNAYDYFGTTGQELSYKDMKTVLAHVIFRLRMQKKLVVVLEENQKCFHITCCS